jgi:exopolysaccharide production protein ExoZ
MPKEIHSIQYLRGIAALMVVLVHMPIQLERMGYNGRWPLFFASGVDIFFIISGFIMWTTTFDGKLTSQKFLVRRFVRIVPLYWALTSITVLVMLISPSSMQSGRFELYSVITSYLFIPSEHPVTHLMEPALAVGWTLNYEMFFYIVFAMCLPLRANYRAATLCAILLFLVSLHSFFPNQQTVGFFYTSSIILEFAFGVVLGALFTTGFFIQGRMAIILILLGVTGIGASNIYGEIPRVLLYGVPATMIVGGCVLYERAHAIIRIGLLHTLGDASYSLYLSHGIVLSAFGQLWRKLGATSLPLNFQLFTILSLFVAGAVTVVVYRLIERPLIKTFRRLAAPDQFQINK